MPADRIRFGNVIRLIDGPLAPIACVSQTAYEPCTCPDEAHCGLHMLMLDVRNTIANILDRYTLADTVEITLRKNAAGPHAASFHGSDPPSCADDAMRPSARPGQDDGSKK